MALLVAHEGPLASGVERGLVAAGHEVRRAAPDDDLFEEALDSTAIVYVPFQRVLEGRMSPTPDVDRARKVLRAANAPGVEVVVFVLPTTEGYAPEEEMLRREGTPYVIVRTPLLVEEVADVLAEDGFRSLWVPREGTVPVATVDDLGRAVAEAVATEDQGGDLFVSASDLAAPDLFARAAELSGDVRVHAVGPRIYRMVRPVARWIRRGEPSALGLWDSLVAA